MLAISPLLRPEDRRNLDRQLTGWYNNLPWLLRTSDPCAEPLYVARCIMKWRYQNLRMLLHRPVLLTLASNGSSGHLSEEEVAAVEACRELACQTIEDVAREWTRNQMSGWNAVWFLYQAAMILLVSIFWQINSPHISEWQKQIETILELLDAMEDWSLAARRSREVVWRMYEASRLPTMTKSDSTAAQAGHDRGLLITDSDPHMSPIGMEAGGMGVMAIVDQQGLWDVDGMFWGQDGEQCQFPLYSLGETAIPLEYDLLSNSTHIIDTTYFS